MNDRMFGYRLIIALITVAATCLPAAAATGNLVVMPVFFSTPETGLAGGLYAIHYDKPDEAVSASYSLARGFFITTQKQQTALGCDIDRQCGKDRFQTALTFSRFPQLFYGIGAATSLSDEEPYTQTETMISAWYQMPVHQKEYWGPMIVLQNYGTGGVREGLQLSSGSVPGSRGVFAAGIGLGYQADSRDSIFSTRSGTFSSIKAIRYTGAYGSSRDFGKIEIDYRQFFSPAYGHVLGFQEVMTVTAGDVPFQVMPKLGGAAIMRGFYYGRYVDKCLAAVQTEYRFPLMKSFGGAVFVSGGGVASSIGQLTSEVFHIAYGCGLRYCIDPGQGISIRVDYGCYNERDEQASMIYITIMEAF